MTAEDYEVISMGPYAFGNEAYVVKHFVAGFEAFGCEELFERFLLLASGAF